METVGTDERENLMSDGRDGRYRNYSEKVLKMSVVTVVRVISLKGRGMSNLCVGTKRTTVPPLRVRFLRF